MKSFMETRAMQPAQPQNTDIQRLQGAASFYLPAFGLDYLVVVSPSILISLPL
jgi:hypothetical protein